MSCMTLNRASSCSDDAVVKGAGGWMVKIILLGFSTLEQMTTVIEQHACQVSACRDPNKV